jgi:hypothetical protein
LPKTRRWLAHFMHSSVTMRDILVTPPEGGQSAGVNGEEL